MGAFSMHDGGYAIASASDVTAAIAQLGERQTEDLKVPGSIPGLGIFEKPCFAVKRHAHGKQLEDLFRLAAGARFIKLEACARARSIAPQQQ